MSFKAPAGAYIKSLSFVVSMSGEGGTGAWSSSDYNATALLLDGTENYMQLTDNGRPTGASSNPGTAVSLPNNIMIVGNELVLSEAFGAYTTFSDGGTTGTSVESVTWDYTFGNPCIYYGTTWSSASDITAQTKNSAGTKLDLVWGLRVSSGSLSVRDPFASSYSYDTGTFGYAQNHVITTGGALSLGYKSGTSSFYGSAASSTENERGAQGKYTLKIYYMEL